MLNIRVNVTPNWSLVSVLTSEQKYSARNWNYEKSTRYVIRSKFGVVEASYFEHYLNDDFVKPVIELPTSYGCPVGCAHCASGDINTSRNLTAEDLSEIFYLVTCQSSAKIRDNTYVLVAFSGIGECSLNKKNLFDFCRKISAKNHKYQFTITTAGIRPSFIADVDKFSSQIDLRWLQITMLHNNKIDLVNKFGRGFQNYDFEEVFNNIYAAKKIRIRLNYVVVKDFNNNGLTISSIVDRILPVKNRVCIRVSQLNETNVSLRNKIFPTQNEEVEKVTNMFCDLGVNAYTFMSTFNDKMNCGQLAWSYQ